MSFETVATKAVWSVSYAAHERATDKTIINPFIHAGQNLLTRRKSTVELLSSFTLLGPGYTFDQEAIKPALSGVDFGVKWVVGIREGKSLTKSNKEGQAKDETSCKDTADCQIFLRFGGITTLPVAGQEVVLDVMLVESVGSL